MIEERGNIWKHHGEGEWIAITTNGSWTNAGKAVMGRGVAAQADAKFSGLSLRLGNSLKVTGNIVYTFVDYKIITFPVKRHWYESATLGKIEDSAKQLKAILSMMDIERVYLPRPGCGAGNLKWEDVRPVIDPILDDRIVICDILR